MLSSRPPIYVFIPLTLPGARKEAFSQVLQELQEVTVNTLWLREIREEVRVNAISIKSETVNSTARKRFKKLLEKVIIDVKNYSSSKPYILFLQENHPPNAWESAFKTIRNGLCGLNLKIVALVPLMRGNPLVYDDNKVFPFTSHFIIDCITKVLTAEYKDDYHKKGEDATQMVVDFSRHYVGTSFDIQYLREKKFDDVFILPFASEETYKPVHEEMEKMLIQALKAPRGSKRDDEFLENITRHLSSKHVQHEYETLGPIRESLIQYFARDGIDLKSLKDKNYLEMMTVHADNSGTLSDCTIISSTYSELRDDILSISSQSVRTNAPTRLGVYPITKELSRLRKFTSKYLEQLKTAFSDDDGLQNNSISNLISINDPHITIDEESNLNSRLYQKMAQLERYEFEVVGLVVSPNKSVIGLCNIDRNEVTIQAQFAYMILMTTKEDQEDEIRSEHEVQEVLNGLFGIRSPLHERYNMGSSKYLIGKMSEKVQIETSKEKMNVYVIGSEEPLEIQAETRKNYIHLDYGSERGNRHEQDLISRVI